MRPFILAAIPALILAGCGGAGDSVEAANGAGAPVASSSSERPFTASEVATFDEPWAMTFLPDGGLLVTEKTGRLLLRERDGSIVEVQGVPQVAYGGQGGLGDVILHPDYRNNGYVYLSYVEAGQNGTWGAVVGRGKLVIPAGAPPRLEGFQPIWRQEPKVSGRGHFGHRLAFSPDGYLFISNGERQKFDPAQDDNQTLGKIVRLTDAGGIPDTNPWYDQGNRIRSQIWSKGHRNPLGLAFDAEGRLWQHEMGPKGGDEFNLIKRGGNYGYPIVSEGRHYNGTDIPDHDTRPEFIAPKISWVPAISPAGLIVYSGNMFPQWKGDAFLGGLSGQALVRVDLDGANARVGDRWDMGERIREVEQGPDGAIYLLEDGDGARLLRLTPSR